MKKYTEDHDWISNDDTGGDWRVGITDYAQEQLGDVVTVELPSVGDEVVAGADCAVIESVKAASDIKSPLTGKVSSVNQTLADNPELINTSPEGEGWLFEVKVDGEPDLDGMMDEQGYQSHTGA